MKKIYKYIAFVIIFIANTANTSAQYNKHEFSITAGGGISTLRYSSDIIDRSNGFGGLVGVNYNYFFNPNLSLYTGVEATLYQSKVRVGNFQNILFNIHDLEGDRLDYYANVRNYVEEQSSQFVNIPLMLQYETNITKSVHRFYVAGGAKIGLPIKTNVEGYGAIFNNEGRFHHDYENVLTSPKFLGYGEFRDKDRKSSFDQKMSVMLALEAGMKWKIGKSTSLYTGVYYDMGLNNIATNSNNQNFVNYNYERPSEFTYNSMLTSHYTANNNPKNFVDKVMPMALGVKIRLAFGKGMKSIPEPPVIDTTPKPIIIKLFGKVFDSINNNTLSEVPVIILKDNAFAQIVTDSLGSFTYTLEPNSTYKLNLLKKGYKPKQVDLITTTDTIVELDIPLSPVTSTLSGKVLDKETKEQIADVAVVLYINGVKTDKTVFTDSEGNYKYDSIKENTLYEVKTESDKYFNDSKQLKIPTILINSDFNKSTGYDLDLLVDKIPEKGKEIKIDNVFYDLNKATLRPESEEALRGLADVIVKNPNLKVQISSHTDARGSDKYNNKLSELRAKNVVQYLVSLGVDESQLTGKGYGKTLLINKNAKTEEEHQENRRTTFMIIGNTDTQ